jgi:hypothetical protein
MKAGIWRRYGYQPLFSIEMLVSCVGDAEDAAAITPTYTHPTPHTPLDGSLPNFNRQSNSIRCDTYIRDNIFRQNFNGLEACCIVLNSSPPHLMHALVHISNRQPSAPTHESCVRQVHGANPAVKYLHLRATLYMYTERRI